MQKKSFLLAIFLFFCFASLSAQQYADCISAMEICKKQTYTFNTLGGEGKDNLEADFTPCFMNGENFGQAEENSAWIRFKVQEGGWLTLTITPHKDDNDIDFVIYRLMDGNCASKRMVRCMAAGYFSKESPCMGKTGLRKDERDSSSPAGCAEVNANAWLAPLRTAKDEEYVILISNVTEKGPGFDISFGGSLKLPCDDEPEEKEEPEIAKAEPVKEKPNPTPIVEAEPEKTKPVTPPKRIGERDVEVGKTVGMKNRTLTVSIWDSQVVDGDVISVYLNDKKVIDHATLTGKPKTYEIQLPAGKEHYLTVYADDFGKSEPNTAKVKISDGKNEQTIDLVAGRTKQESVKIVLD